MAKETQEIQDDLMLTPNKPEHILRTARSLETYKRFFGAQFGEPAELILDVGAGDATAADEIAEMDDHKAEVIRLDADYTSLMPKGEAPAIAADAAKMPFDGKKFDRITSLWLFPHLGPEKGAKALEEMFRVLKVGGEIMIFPSRPLKKIGSAFAHKQKFGSPFYTPPTLVVSKPKEFDTWDSLQKQEIYRELASYTAYGGKVFKAMKWLMAKSIKLMGTNRTIEVGSRHSLLRFKRKG